MGKKNKKLLTGSKDAEIFNIGYNVGTRYKAVFAKEEGKFDCLVEESNGKSKNRIFAIIFNEEESQSVIRHLKESEIALT